jgi:hypothetical protein
MRSSDTLRRQRPSCLAVLLAAVAAVVALAVADPAQAHDGAGSAFDGPAGPYRVLAYDGVATSPGARDDEYAVVLTDRRTGAPVDAATVTVSAQRGDRPSTPGTIIGPLRADDVGNVYRYALPSAGDAGWRVALKVRSARGDGQAVFSVHGEPDVTAAASPEERREALPLFVAGGVGMLLAAAVAIPLLGAAERSRGGRHA